MFWWRKRKSKQRKETKLERFSLQTLSLLAIYEKTLFNLDVAVAIFEPDSTELIYIFANKAYLDCFGLNHTPSSIRGLSHYEVFEGLAEARPDFKEQNDRVITHRESKRSTEVDCYEGSYFHWKIFPNIVDGEMISANFEIYPAVQTDG